VAVGRQAVQQLAERLKAAGLTIKPGSIRVRDLARRQMVQLLGYRIGASEDLRSLRIEPGKAAWDKLRDGLDKAHKTTNPPERTQQVIHGWLAANGPAFESVNRDEVLERIQSYAAHAGFRELSSPEALVATWSNANRLWQGRRKAARERYAQSAGSTVGPAMDAASVPTLTNVPGDSSPEVR
jgi:hypothetical protein